jgi:hypothetical protein
VAVLDYNTLWGYYEDGSFTRLRELSVTYDLPNSVARRLNARTVSITVSGRNLALWTRYTGTDPEVNTNIGETAAGAYADAGGLPPATYWLVRVNLGL